MKKAILAVMLFVLFAEQTKAQKTDGYHEPAKRHMCVATKVGILSLTVGLLTTAGGFLMELSAGADYEHSYYPDQKAKAERKENTAIVVRDAGIVIAVGSIATLVTGAVTEGNRILKHRFSLVAPRTNSIGLAYNF